MRYVLAGFAGALLAVFLLGAAPATQDVVRCRRLEVVDNHGSVLVWADAGDDAPGGFFCVVGSKTDKGNGGLMTVVGTEYGVGITATSASFDDLNAETITRYKLKRR